MLNLYGCKSPSGFDPHRFRMENREILEEELEILQKLKIITLKRKLSGGLLFIPEELEFAYPDGEDEPSFEEELVGAMIDQIEFTQETGKRLPVIIRGDEKLFDKVQYINFHDDSMIDVEDIERRIESLKDRLKSID